VTTPEPSTTGLPARRLPPMGHYAKATLVVIGVVVLAYVLYRARSVALSVFLGFFLATGFDPLINALERRGIRRGFAVLLFFFAALAAVVLFVWLALRPAIQQAGEFVEQIPELIDRLGDRNGIFGKYLADPEVQQQVKAFAGKIPGFLTSSVGTVFSVLGAIVGGLFSAFTILALMIYFMLAMPRIRSFTARALGDAERVAVMDDALGKVGGYVTGQLTVSGLAGIFAYIFLAVAGVPYAAVLAIAVALLDAIPQVGATLGAILCSLVAFTESVTLGLVTFGALLAYQQLENYVIAPRVFARAVELSPVAVFIAVLAGGSLAGFVGALTALPVTAALKVVFRYAFRRQLAAIGVTTPGARSDDEPVGAAPAGHAHAAGAEDPVHPHDEPRPR
jgi:predicted PurR-regulated permease PerM